MTFGRPPVVNAEWLRENGYLYDQNLSAWIHRDRKEGDPLDWPFAVTDELLSKVEAA